MPIQVDMFEVQLGSALLLQFRREADQIVRILADAGVKADGYRQNHVHEKLTEAFQTFEQQFVGLIDRRIDLIIGTHYDKDHLYGLVPIIEDSTIEIGEAWLPPVANDTETILDEITPDITRMLSIQFSQEDGKEKLYNYLRQKANICKYVRSLENVAATNFESVNFDIGDAGMALKHAKILKRNEPNHSESWNGDIDSADRYFALHLNESSHLTKACLQPHDDVEIIEPNLKIVTRTIERASSASPFVWFSDTDRKDRILGRFDVHFENLNSELLSLCYIRRAAAADAINARSLFSVVEALRRRNIPIRTEIIPNGLPRRYGWSIEKRRFVPGLHLPSDRSTDGPVLTLLGPSEGLVQKHWKRLPIGTYAKAAKFTAIPIKSITPSNQLSYVVKFHFDRQSILITGDAGCVDFRRGRRGKYYRKLLNALSTLHVVQVAHHAGNNAHFYRVLQKAGYAKQAEKSYLLLSHATQDRHRPSDAFRIFIGNIRRPGRDIKLLFTSKPKEDKVEDYDELIAPSVGYSGDKGDVRLSFEDGSWKVQKHAVRV